MTRKYFVISFALVIAALLATVILHPQMPSRVSTHWNALGQINGNSAKWTLFLFGPGIMAGMLGLFALLPWLSPRHFEVDWFRPTYLYVMLVMIAFMGYVHALLLWAAVAGRVDISRGIWGGVCLLFALLGNVMGRVRRNFYIGIRTPWSLANERVWNATHRFASKATVMGGLAGLALSFVKTGFWIPFSVLIAGALIPAFYSLVNYKKLERRGEV